MDAATRSMIDQLPRDTGRSLDEWFAVLGATGFNEHFELMNHLKDAHGITPGFANSIVLIYRDPDARPSPEALVNAQYAGQLARLRPLYDAIIASVAGFGPNVTVAPARRSVALRRSKLFARIEARTEICPEPASAQRSTTQQLTTQRLKVDINLPDTPPTERLLAAKGTCARTVAVARPAEVNVELIGWLRQAYERS